MTVCTTCSWCHEMNDVTPPPPVFCGNCGHRADRARLDCDCDACRRCAALAAERLAADARK